MSLGVCYMNGFGVEEDEEEAAKWFQKAAEQEDTDAQSAPDPIRTDGESQSDVR